MKSSFRIIAVVLLCVVATCYGWAQNPIPVTLELGIGGGATLPSGKLSDVYNTGWHAGAKARIRAILPLNIVASANYHKLPQKTGGDSSYVETMLGAGLELPLLLPAVKPYFGIDILVNVLSNSANPGSTKTREGLGLGAGLEFSIPMIGSFDTSLKYQMLNIVGQESREESISQIAANISFMFSVL